MRRILLALSTLALTAPAPAADPPKGVVARIKATNTITLGHREQARPFSFTGEDGKPADYSVDLCLKVVEGMRQALNLRQIKVKWVPLQADNRVQAVAAGKVDMENFVVGLYAERQGPRLWTHGLVIEDCQVTDGAGLQCLDGGPNGNALITTAALGNRVAVSPVIRRSADRGGPVHPPLARCTRLFHQAQALHRADEIHVVHHTLESSEQPARSRQAAVSPWARRKARGTRSVAPCGSRSRRPECATPQSAGRAEVTTRNRRSIPP